MDVSFLYFEETTTPMHVGAVLLFAVPDGGFDYDRLVQLISDRISLVPRYRQRVKWVPGHLANPVWVDDPGFDIGYHVRRSALPRPGSDAQLRELVGRIMARPLDRNRPLWEMYLVEGVTEGRFALLSKTHHAMVDGVGAIDIGQVILDPTRESRHIEPATWNPGRAPSALELVVGAVTDAVRSPASIVDSLRSEAVDLQRVASRVVEKSGGLFSALQTVARPPQSSPLNAPIGAARRFAAAEADLADFKALHGAHGVTINDVVLAVSAGALRSWLQQRGEPVTLRSTVRALVPVSVRDEVKAGTGSGNHIAAFLCELPIGEPKPLLRLQRIAYEMGQHKASGQLTGARALAGLAGFAPPTLHSLGARVASGMSRRLFNLIITNVPGPQVELFAGGARLLKCYPVVPLARGQALSIGVTSYNGRMYFGLNADRDALPDVEFLAEALLDELAALLATLNGRSALGFGSTPAGD